MTVLHRAVKVRKQCKAHTVSLSLEYRTQLALAKESVGEFDAAVYLCNVNHIEAFRKNPKHTPYGG